VLIVSDALIKAHKQTVAYMPGSRLGDSWWWFCHEGLFDGDAPNRSRASHACSVAPFEDNFVHGGGYPSAAAAIGAAKRHRVLYHWTPGQDRCAWRRIGEGYWTRSAGADR
jgi:hypothetical protein